MSELTELYQELILDHYKHPRNRGHLAAPTHTAEGHNPLCGDQLRIFLHVRDAVIDEISFEGSGCAISTASASLMTAHLKGKSVDEAHRVFAIVQRMLTGHSEEGLDLKPLGKLAALSGVCEFPVRVKCAALAWRTLEAALVQAGAKATTECPVEGFATHATPAATAVSVAPAPTPAAEAESARPPLPKE